MNEMLHGVAAADDELAPTLRSVQVLGEIAGRTLSSRPAPAIAIVEARPQHEAARPPGAARGAFAARPVPPWPRSVLGSIATACLEAGADLLMAATAARPRLRLN
jgi:hypothetical protein